ncbi:hypothetical protein Nepgr_006693 [Nepenthes gracilis]|uniref:Uncharacterized protein n=1 Tax=Nepenthes gracilis TaxID=150966 RepID=A0AAD3S5M5_NEPGR|nr:hypothetical protein Nepgr_006693 [Nepenthes gracilis]
MWSAERESREGVPLPAPSTPGARPSGLANYTFKQLKTRSSQLRPATRNSRQAAFSAFKHHQPTPSTTDRNQRPGASTTESAKSSIAALRLPAIGIMQLHATQPISAQQQANQQKKGIKKYQHMLQLTVTQQLQQHKTTAHFKSNVNSCISNYPHQN